MFNMKIFRVIKEKCLKIPERYWILFELMQASFNQMMYLILFVNFKWVDIL